MMCALRMMYGTGNVLVTSIYSRKYAVENDNVQNFVLFISIY